MLLHLIDGTSDDPAADYLTIINELELYGGNLAAKPRITVLNKIDALDDAERSAKRYALQKASGGAVMLMSGVSREGLTDVLRALRSQIDEDRLRHKVADAPVADVSWQP